MNHQKSYNDKRIIRGCIKRDLGAWQRFIDKYSRLISVSIECRLRKHGFNLPHHDIEDIRQNLLATIWEKRTLKTVLHTRDITYWIAIVSGNFAMQHLRRHRLGRETALPVGPDRADLLMAGIGGDEQGTETDLVREEMREAVCRAIDSLPHHEKVVIQLKIVHDKSYEEIAKILRLPRGTVSSYVNRAKDRLRSILKDYLTDD